MYDIIIQKERKMFFVLSRAWDKEKNSESQWGIKPQTYGFRTPMLYRWPIETKPITKFIYDTRPAYYMDK